MPLLVTEAQKLSQAQMELGVIEEIIDIDELFALFPFMNVEGKSYFYHREKTLSEADFLDPYETVNEGAATFDEISTRLRILIGDVDMDKFVTSTMSDSNPQKAIQIAAKAKGLARKFRRALVNGDSVANPKEFDGVKVLTPASQTLIAGANGAALTLSMLDELRDAVKTGAQCFMMRRGTWRAIKALLRSFGGNTAEMIMIPNFGRPVPTYDGLPVILNDFINADEAVGSGSNLTSIYAMRLDEANGLHGIVGGEAAGMVVEDIGTVQNKDSNRTRLKWYVGTALKGTQSLARLKGLTNV